MKLWEVLHQFKGVDDGCEVVLLIGKTETEFEIKHSGCRKWAIQCDEPEISEDKLRIKDLESELNHSEWEMDKLEVRVEALEKELAEKEKAESNHVNEST